MKTLAVVLLTALACSPATAALESLDNESLSEVWGQSGANIELELRLNQTITGSPAAPTSVTRLCTDPLDCRLGIKLNNRTPWLVFKGVSGGIYIPQMSLDGSDISYVQDDNVTTTWQGAIRLGFGGAANKIRFDNFGFESMAAENDISGTPGYRVLTEKDGANFTDGKYTAAASVYDTGREVGFLGLNINGNVAINGTIRMFSCPANHKRC